MPHVSQLLRDMGTPSATSPSLKDVCDSQAQALSIYLGTQIGAQLWSSPYLSRIAAQDYSPPLKPWGETSKSSSPERAIEEPHHCKIFDYSTKCSRVAQRFSAAMNRVLKKAALAGEVHFSAQNIFPVLLALVLTASSAAVTKPHVITFGKWTPVQWTGAIDADESLSQ